MHHQKVVHQEKQNAIEERIKDLSKNHIKEDVK
jgi:hypothetical protein